MMKRAGKRASGNPDANRVNEGIGVSYVLRVKSTKRV
jgi:hypothetical protein